MGKIIFIDSEPKEQSQPCTVVALNEYLPETIKSQ